MIKLTYFSKKDLPNSDHITIGKIGEEVATMFLVKHGHVIKERNHLRKWGEIDIITEFKEKIHFIEVKTVSRVTLKEVTRETGGLRPEANVHENKQKRLKRVFQSYLGEDGLSKGKWQFDIVSVYISQEENKALVKVFKDVVL